MKFLVRKTSDWTYKSEINIETIEDLMEFICECNEKVIIDADNTIEIYDDWRE